MALVTRRDVLDALLTHYAEPGTVLWEDESKSLTFVLCGKHDFNEVLHDYDLAPAVSIVIPGTKTQRRKLHYWWRNGELETLTTTTLDQERTRTFVSIDFMNKLADLVEKNPNLPLTFVSDTYAL